MERFSKNTTNRISETYVSDNSVAEEGAYSTPCAIKELVGNYNIERLNLFLQIRGENKLFALSKKTGYSDIVCSGWVSAG